MSSAGQPNRSPRKRKITRQTASEPTLQTELDALCSTVAARRKRDFDPHAFIATISEGRKFVLFPRKQIIFAQGDTADAVFYIQTGKVKLTVVSKTGKEATIGILGDGDFRRRWSCRSTVAHVICDRDDRLRGSTDRQERHDGSTSSGTRILRPVRRLLVSTEHPLRRGFGRSVVQLQ